MKFILSVFLISFALARSTFSQQSKGNCDQPNDSLSLSVYGIELESSIVKLQQLGYDLLSTKVKLRLVANAPSPCNPISLQSNVSFALSIDPLVEQFPDVSPYNAMDNNPITMLDPDGKKIEFAPGTSQEFKNKFALAVQKLNDVDLSGSIAQLEASSEVIYIQQGSGNDDAFHPSGKLGNIDYSKAGWHQSINGATDVNIIVWNPNNGLQIVDNTGALINQYQSPVLGLYHEAQHALQYVTNAVQFETDLGIADPTYDNLEEKRVGALEDNAASSLREPQRTNHYGKQHTTTTSTSTKGGKASWEEKLHEKAAWAKFEFDQWEENDFGIGTKPEAQTPVYSVDSAE